MRAVLVQAVWCLCLCAAAQNGFNRRYDAANEGRPQTAFGIEKVGVDSFMVFTGSADLDSISPDTVETYYAIYLQLIDGQGNLLGEHKTRRAGHGIFLGWANCCDTLKMDAGFAIGGGCLSYGGINEARLMKMTSVGDTVWTRTFGGVNEFWIGQQVKSTLDGGFLICGSTDATSYEDAFAIKTDSLGIEQWRRTYGLGGVVIDGFSSIAVLSSGYLLSGVTYPSMNNSDFYVQRVDSLGHEGWGRRFGSAFNEPNGYVERLSNGQILLAGAWAHDDTGSESPYLALLDTTDGGTIWEHAYDYPSYGKTLFAAKERPNHDLIACGVSYEGGDQQGLLLRTNSEGDSIWMRRYLYQDTLVTAGEGRFYDVLPTNDGGFIAAGAVYGPLPTPAYSQDTWVVKVDSMGCLLPGCNGVGITEQITNLLNAITVSPNPAHGEVQVQLQLPNSLAHEVLELSIVGMDGRVVRRMPWAGNGSNTMQVDVHDLSAGMYTLHVTDGTKWITGTKLVIE